MHEEELECTAARQEEASLSPESATAPETVGNDGAEAERQRRDADIREFLREFPEVRPSEIEPEVWEKVRQGKSLVSAFRSRKEEKLLEENSRLRARLQTEDANARNRQKSIGSQRTSGQDAGRDVFLEALLGGDG